MSFKMSEITLLMMQKVFLDDDLCLFKLTRIEFSLDFLFNIR